MAAAAAAIVRSPSPKHQQAAETARIGSAGQSLFPNWISPTYSGAVHLRADANTLPALIAAAFLVANSRNVFALMLESEFNRFFWV